MRTTRGFLGIIDGVAGSFRSFPGVSCKTLKVADVKNIGKIVKIKCDSGVSSARAIPS